MSQQINVMAEPQLISASPIHSIAKVIVWIKPDPGDGEVYEIDTKEDEHGNRVPVLALTKIGLDRLFQAAGVEQDTVGVTFVAERRWSAEFNGHWMQPDGTSLPLVSTKEIDLRIGGTRYEERKQKEMIWLLKAEGKRRGVEWPKGMSTVQYSARVEYILIKEDPDKFDELSFISGRIAQNYVTQAAQFGSELAESGAANRATRKLMNIGHYTAEELMSKPFVVYRCRFDWERASEVLGPGKTQMLLEKVAEVRLGLPEGSVAMAPQKLEEDESEIQEVEYVEDNPFLKQASADSILEITKALGVSRTTPDKAASSLLKLHLSDLTEGHARLIVKYLLVANEEQAAGKTAGQIKEYMAYVKILINKCAEEMRQPTDDELRQPTLPGVEDVSTNSTK